MNRTYHLTVLWVDIRDNPPRQNIEQRIKIKTSAFATLVFLKYRAIEKAENSLKGLFCKMKDYNAVSAYISEP